MGEKSPYLFLRDSQSSEKALSTFDELRTFCEQLYVKSHLFHETRLGGVSEMRELQLGKKPFLCWL
jgi:hypothetical protein